MTGARGGRWLGAALVCALVAAGCGDDSPGSGDGDGALPVGAATDTTAPDQTSVAGPSTPGDGSAQPDDATQPPDVGVSDPPSASPPPTVSGNVAVGQLGPFLLRPDQGSRIVLELSAQDGAAPASGTIDHLAAVVRDVSAKHVVVDEQRAVPGGATSWTAGQLRSLADDLARNGQGGGTGVIRLLFLHGDLDGDDSVLGVAVRGDVAAIFVDRVRDSAGLLANPGVLEDAVTVHEVGHILGLVDLVLSTGRADPEHPGHSRSAGSVMYWAVESSLVTQLLGGGPPRDFDADDLADLRTIRGG